jgi:hypothetical protein
MGCPLGAMAQAQQVCRERKIGADDLVLVV